MLTPPARLHGYSYDPILVNGTVWHFHGLRRHFFFSTIASSSCGLVCFINKSQLSVCNPITKECKMLDKPPGLKDSRLYTALAISVDRISHTYTVTIVNSTEVPGNLFQSHICVYVYESKTMKWVTTATEISTQWRGGNESVICDGILYFVYHLTGLFSLDLHGRSSQGMLRRVHVPSLSCIRLMNLKDKLVLVGGIGEKEAQTEQREMAFGFSDGKEWQEVSRMPHEFFQEFGEIEKCFASSGIGDLIYIHSYGAPLLIVFDMNQKLWKWPEKCPLTRKFPLQLFTGFCFEPRLEIAP